MYRSDRDRTCLGVAKASGVVIVCMCYSCLHGCMRLLTGGVAACSACTVAPVAALLGVDSCLVLSLLVRRIILALAVARLM